MINWKNPLEEMPEDGAHVACMQYYWKQCWPLSAEIIFGEVESYIDEDGKRIVKVNTCDYTGAGNYCWYFPVFQNTNSDCIRAWAYASDFKKPSFLDHNCNY